MSAAYFDGIEPSIADSGFQALRIDRKETIGKIDDEIIAEKGARVLLLQISRQN
jgi:hypothetical protein